MSGRFPGSRLSNAASLPATVSADSTRDPHAEAAQSSPSLSAADSDTSCTAEKTSCSYLSVVVTVGLSLSLVLPKN